MAKAKDIKKIIKELNPEAIFIRGFDKALYGTGKTIGGNTVAVYNADECLQILVDEHEMDELEAWDHFNDTVVKGSKSSNKPVFISDWRWAINIEQVLEDIKLDKQRTLNNIIEQVKKKKEEDEANE